MTVYVRVRVASETYALPVEHVLEVARLGEVTAVPGARPEVIGLLSLRGRVLPVVDLARLLRISRREPPGQLLVAEWGGVRAGFAIDGVSEVGELPEPTAQTESDLLTGAVLTGGELIGVIDVPAVFARMRRLEQ